MPAGKANLFWWVTVVLAMLVSISLSLRLSVSHCCVAESVDCVERFQMELYAGQARQAVDYDHWKRRLISSMVYDIPRTKASLSNCSNEPQNMLFSPKNNWSMCRATMSTERTVCLHFLWAAGGKRAFSECQPCNRFWMMLFCAVFHPQHPWLQLKNHHFP